MNLRQKLSSLINKQQKSIDPRDERYRKEYFNIIKNVCKVFIPRKLMALTIGIDNYIIIDALKETNRDAKIAVELTTQQIETKIKVIKNQLEKRIHIDEYVEKQIKKALEEQDKQFKHKEQEYKNIIRSLVIVIVLLITALLFLIFVCKAKQTSTKKAILLFVSNIQKKVKNKKAILLLIIAALMTIILFKRRINKNVNKK